MILYIFTFIKNTFLISIGFYFFQINELQLLSKECEQDVINAKLQIKNHFLDVKSSCRHISEDLVKTLDTIDNKVTEKLNILASVVDSFIFEYMSELHTLNHEKRKKISDILKKVIKTIVTDIKQAVEVNNVNKYHIILRYGNSEIKNELLNNLESEDVIPDKIKITLKQASHNSPNYINAAEAGKFVATLYRVYLTKIHKVLKFARKQIKECEQIMKS